MSSAKKDVGVGLADLDEAEGNKKIHKSIQLEFLYPIRIQFARFVADHGDLEPVPDFERGDYTDHFMV